VVRNCRSRLLLAPTTPGECGSRLIPRVGPPLIWQLDLVMTGHNGLARKFIKYGPCPESTTTATSQANSVSYSR
jgi:hypothetical protein